MPDGFFTAALALWPASLGGALLGAAFYGSLWWTVQRGLRSLRPTPWFIGGFALRMSLGVIAIHLIGDGQWPRLAACLSGFVMARLLIVRMSRPAAVRLDGSRG